MDGLEILIQSLVNKIGALYSRAQAGEVGVATWYAIMTQLLTRYSLAALMVGFGRSDLDEDDLLVSWELINGQLEYLDGFRLVIESAGEFRAGWQARAESYAKGIKVPYWRGNTQMLPLPAMPAEGTQCMGNCGCLWNIVPINAEAGDFDCYWERHKDDSCQTCLERESQWNPLQIRGGVLVNPFVKEYLGETLKHLQGKHDQSTHGSGGGGAELTTEEKEAVYTYTGEWRYANAKIRQGEPLNDRDEKIKSLLNQAVEKSPVDSPIVTHRGAGFDSPEFRNQIQKGAILEDKGFVSVTSKKETADGFTSTTYPTLFNITIPAGAKALDISGFSGRPYEKEMLLSSGSRFKITNVTVIPNTDPDMDFPEFPGVADQWVIDMELIP